VGVRAYHRAHLGEGVRQLDGAAAGPHVYTDGDYARDPGGLRPLQGLREITLQEVQVGVGVDEVQLHHFFVSMRGKRASPLNTFWPAGKSPHAPAAGR
jgi:hypothetical protein